MTRPPRVVTDQRVRAAVTCVWLLLAGWLLPAFPAAGLPEAANAAEASAAGFAAARPVLTRYCIACHSGDSAEGEVDLSFTADPAGLGRHAKVMQRVAEMVTSGQMPPPDSDQPTDAERQTLADWLRAFLAAEARAHAGDPGRVVLRRLNNAEYTHTIRDLTGVDGLDPAREFPADGGAGEGFTNTGQSLVMSPSLAAKYLDAAKGIAAHAVLLPDGLRFSAGDSRRDFADEALARLKRFYARYSQPGLHQSMLALERERARLAQGGDAMAAMARERGLNPKYLGTLHAALAADEAGSPRSTAGEARENCG
jgi:mono/diheme cytochrome c family protein